MFNSDQRLVFCNPQYVEIYSLPAGLTVPGTEHQKIVKYRTAQGMQMLESSSEFLQRHEAVMRMGEATITKVKLGNGRIIAIRHQPLRDGGWVATHDDITAEAELTQSLEAQNMRFDAALNNMRQGLCMFDGERRLVVSNRRYSEIYGLDPKMVRPGMLLKEILQQRLAAGNVPIAGKDTFLSSRLAIAAANQPGSSVIELADGRVIAVIHEPLSDGGWLATHEDITEQRRTQERIRHLARHDILTDLANRTQFDECLQTVRDRVESGETLAVLALDLDHFKAVNDSLGHSAGDAVLKEVSCRVRQCVGATDLVSRLGGDEFAIVQSIRAAEEAEILAGRIVTAIAQPFDFEDHRVQIGVSIGIAIAPLDGPDGQVLMKRADRALYRAKAEGRSCYHLYERKLDEAQQQRRGLEADLRLVIERHELRLVFQPTIRLSDFRITSMEASLRWDHPSRGLLEPSIFVPVAIETGVIKPILEWVLREACNAAARWPSQVPVAVNLPPVRLGKDDGLSELVQSALSASGISPGQLQLEFAESHLHDQMKDAITTLNHLKAIGVKMTIEKFGSGCSSLSVVGRFPFDKIKIDPSLVGDLSTGGNTLSMVRAVIAVGRCFRMTTTAERIETELQLETVRREGCTEAQGFLFGYPLPAAAASELLRECESEGAAVGSKRPEWLLKPSLVASS